MGGRRTGLETEVLGQGWDSGGDGGDLLAVSLGVLVRIGFGVHPHRRSEGERVWYQWGLKAACWNPECMEILKVGAAETELKTSMSSIQSLNDGVTFSLLVK